VAECGGGRGLQEIVGIGICVPRDFSPWATQRCGANCNPAIRNGSAFLRTGSTGHWMGHPEEGSTGCRRAQTPSDAASKRSDSRIPHLGAAPCCGSRISPNRLVIQG
jgi:hypothetical protein